MNNRRLRMAIIGNSVDDLYTDAQEIKATRICKKLTKRINKSTFGNMNSNNTVKCIADYQYLCE